MYVAGGEGGLGSRDRLRRGSGELYAGASWAAQRERLLTIDARVIEGALARQRSGFARCHAGTAARGQSAVGASGRFWAPACLVLVAHKHVQAWAAVLGLRLGLNHGADSLRERQNPRVSRPASEAGMERGRGRGSAGEGRGVHAREPGRNRGAAPERA